MKQSNLFYRTRKEIPSDADSINASYLIRAGFVDKHMAGVYAILPLGFRVLKKIEKIIREEMNAIEGQEILMNVLQPKELWEETERWQDLSDIFYQFKDSRNKELGLAPTHEEQITDIVRKNLRSYKDLPVALYQIQTKFRNEARAKSGLLRGREFIMKDLYSFHASEEDLMNYYEIVKKAYFKIYDRMELEAKAVEAGGGTFSKISHEFQVLIPNGEDTVYFCSNCDFAQNKEIATVKEGDDCPKCGGKIAVEKATEVGNIFPLKTKYSEAMKALFTEADGKEKPIMMGCYGIGLTRCLATIVEKYYDLTQNKMVWPREVAPYLIHLISLKKNDEAERIYAELKDKFEILFDDREMSAGAKFAEADLIGCPIRVIISEKSLAAGGAEVLEMKQNKSRIIPMEKLAEELHG